jgi:hypothetical protein
MSHLVSRILLSILVFPLAGIFYVFVATLMEESFQGVFLRREQLMFLISGALTWLGVAAYWCLLWKSSVRWNSWRLGGTALAGLGALMVGAIFGYIAAFLFPSGGEDFGEFIGGVLIIVLWLIATILIWRETPTERRQRVMASGRSTVTCPTCGYNMTGLSESRCPECGGKFTLDELMASQPNAIAEIE